MAAVGYPRSMSDPSVLLLAADRLADRFRSMPQGRLTALAPEGLWAARRLARRSQALEGGMARPELPDVGIFAVGDQIALTAHDLAAALGERAGAGDREDDGDAGDGDAGDTGDDGPGLGAERALAASLADLEAVYRLATTRSARM